MGCEQSQILNMINGNDQPRPTPQQQQYNPQQQQYYPQQQQYYPQQQPSSNYNPQMQEQNAAYQQPKQEKVQSQAVPNQSNGAPAPTKKKKPQEPREILQSHVNFQDDYFTHHLRYQLTLSKFSTASRIQMRQILEHFNLQQFWGNIGGKGINIQAYLQSVNTAWLQRSFLNIWQIAHDQFFNQNVQQKLVRRKVAQQYMFEIYQLKEYVDAGLGNLNSFCEKTRCDLFYFLQFSDDALFNIFKKLKDRYPQTGQTQKTQFPDVPSTKTSLNLLDNFPSKTYLDPPNINIQTIYEDINMLLKKAVELQDVFKEDMKQILGSDALACPKVNQVIKDGGPEFNACAVRRVFVKWAENLLQSCPDLYTSKAFLRFVKAKAQISNNFFFKSTVQKSTHKIVIDTICYLIEVAKYNLTDQQKRKGFIFNIYDLLRCKIKRNSPNQIVALLRKMESTKVTKNGQKFEVLRVKNRFKTNNRDLLINFRYGDILVGEAQLCMDDANVSKLTKHNYQFCHYIYELQRSLFGPTLELMMQYEDFQRPDISVSFEAEDLVDRRGNQAIESSQPTNRLCLQGHSMIGLTGNYFVGDDPQQQIQASCNYCDRITNSGIMYDYCFHCNCYLCRECLNQHKNFNPKTNWLSVQREDLVTRITNLNQIKSQCASKNSIVVLFYIDHGACNQIFKDALIYHQSKLNMQPNKFIPKVAIANCSEPNLRQLSKVYNIKEFPTLILFNQQAQPVRTIIGFSWLQVPFIIETQRRLIAGESIEIQLTCAGCQGNQQIIQFHPLQQMQTTAQLCLNCFNTNQPIDVPEEYKAVGGFCSNGHFKCLACSYAALDIPSTYRDPTGQSYLRTTLVNPTLKKCPKGHVPKLSKKNLLGVWEYVCYGCNKKKLFDDQNGVAICEPCKVGLCARCMGFKSYNLKELDEKSDLAIHYVESTAQEGTLCACTRHFKKAYKTRILDFQELLNNNSQQNKKWTCRLCRQTGNEGQLHLGCFNCPAMFSEDNKKGNFQVCMTCATKTGLLLRQPQEKVREEGSYFVCPNRHLMIKTSLAYDQQLTFDCIYCKRKYFGNTQRVYCKTCKTNCCEACIEKLMNAKPPQCNQYCKKKHPLKLFYQSKRLQFCAGCTKVIRKQNFSCASCKYTLCVDCSHKPEGFIGTALDDFISFMKSNQHIESDEQQSEQNFNFGEVNNGYQASEGGGLFDDMDFDF